MVRDALKQRSSASSDQRRHHGRFPRVPIATAPDMSALCALGGCQRSEPKSLEPSHGGGQRAGQYCVASRLAATDPTSSPSALRCKQSLFDTSSSTSSPLKLEIRCCIDQLNPQSGAVLTGEYS